LRLDAMLKDKNNVAAMMNPPFSTRAVKEGLKDMGTAAAALGAYRARRPSCCVLGASNSDTLVKYVQAYIEAGAGPSIRRNKAEVVKILVERLKLTGTSRRSLSMTPRAIPPRTAPSTWPASTMF